MSTDGFRISEPFSEDDTFTQQYGSMLMGEYADGDVHVGACENVAGVSVALTP